MKIKCGKEHFISIGGTRYVVVTEVKGLLAHSK